MKSLTLEEDAVGEITSSKVENKRSNTDIKQMVEVREPTADVDKPEMTFTSRNVELITTERNPLSSLKERVFTAAKVVTTIANELSGKQSKETINHFQIVPFQKKIRKAAEVLRCEAESEASKITIKEIREKHITSKEFRLTSATTIICTISLLADKR